MIFIHAHACLHLRIAQRHAATLIFVYTICRLKMDSIAENSWLAPLQSNTKDESWKADICPDDGHL